MAVLAIAAAGAYAGGALITGTVLGMSGAGIGWLAGSMLGNMLFAEKQNYTQPAIGDKAVQTSAYGGFQTIVYGTMRVSGTVIDGLDEVREVLTTTEVGKGGPSGEYTTRSYNADIAIDLCQAGVMGIRKIWSAGKLIYDVSSGGTAASIIASAVNARSVKLYDGSETQLPDPTLEAYHGAGNVPAYRGRSYIVFAGIDCPNGQVPQLSFEVCMAITASSTLPALSPAVPFMPANATQSAPYTVVSRVCGPDVVYHMIANLSAAYDWAAEGYKVGIGYVQKIWSTTFVSRGTGAYGYMPGMTGSYKTPRAVRAALGLNGTYTTTNTISVIDLLTGVETVTHSFVPGDAAHNMVPATAAWDEITQKFIVIGNDAGGATYERFNPAIYTLSGQTSVRLALPATAGYQVAFYNDVVYTLDQRSGQTYLQSYSGSSGAFITEIGGGSASIGIGFAPNGSDPISGVSVVGFTCEISAHAGGVFVYDKLLAKAWRVDGTWQEVGSAIANSTTANLGIASSYICNDYIVEGPLVAAPDGDCHYRVAATKSFDPADVVLGPVLSDICQRAGAPVGILNTAAQTATLRGYALTRLGPARSSLEPLLKAYFVDVREQDGGIQFLNRADQASSFTVSIDDMGAATDMGSTADPFPLNRVDDTQLPSSLSVGFIDQDADYRTGTQRVSRQVVNVINDVTVELPMAITANRAATVAQVLMFDAWSQRNRRSVSLSRQFAAVSPGDVGTFEYPAGSYTTKRVQRVSDNGQTVTLELVDGEVALYSTSAQGAAQPGEQAGLSLISPARMVIMDIPILRDQDNGNVLYIALEGYTSPWPGAGVYMGADDANLAVIGSVSSGTVIGVTNNALGDWVPNTVDYVNSVTVQDVDSLASTTLDSALTNGDNLCLIGSEVVQYLTATLVSANKYTLSNLLRGRRGTESAKATHTAFENFVRLPTTGAGIIRPTLDLGAINQVRKYRAISTGLTLASEQSVNFTATGASLKPFAPVDFRRSSINGASYLTWNRRSRFSGEFPDGTDIALGEAAELYYVDVYADSSFGAVVRTIQVSTPLAIYTSAQQALDFGGFQQVLYLRIYQVSALIGRGFPLQVTSNVANTTAAVAGLIAHFDAATPTDSSVNAFAGVLTGSAVLSTTQSKFGGQSLYVPGTTTHGCNFDTSDAMHSFGTGDFTVEFFFLPTVAVTTSHHFSIGIPGTIGSVTEACLYINVSQSTQSITAQTYAGAASDVSIATTTGVFTTGAWNHVALVRRSAVLYLYVNGVLRASGASVGALNYATTFKVMVGGWQTQSANQTYFDEVRVLKGEAAYSGGVLNGAAAFTPPIAPF